jgi:hypothetical protein
MKIITRLVAVLLFGMALVAIAHAQFLSKTAIGPGGGTPVPTPTPTPTPSTPNVNPGDNLETKISSNPTNFTFLLACGTYRLATSDTDYKALVPQNGQSFIGSGTLYDPDPNGALNSKRLTTTPCVVLNGAIVIPTNSPDTSWHTSGSLWYNTVGSANVINSTNGSCLDSTNSACTYPQDLFIDNVVVARTVNWPPTNNTVNGSNECYWYLDISGAHGPANTVWLACDPTNHTVELTVVPGAFAGSNSNITIQNLVMEKFAAPNQSAVVQPTGSGWTIENNLIWRSHGEAIKPKAGSSQILVTHNEVAEMGQGGLHSGGGTNNEFSFNVNELNNVDDIAYGNECGSKFAADSGVYVHDNFFINNNCDGLWEDSGGVGVRFIHNTTYGNEIEDLRFEISGSPSQPSYIQQNTVGPGMVASPSLCVAAHVPRLIWSGSTGLVDACTGFGTASGLSSACVKGSGISTFGEIDVADSNSVAVGGSSTNANTVTSNCAGLRVTQGTRLLSYAVAMSYNKVTMHTDSVTPNAPIGLTSSSTFNVYNPNSSCTGSGTATNGTTATCCTGAGTGTCTPDSFNYDAYTFDSTGGYNGSNGKPFTDQNGQRTWAQWQADGWDVNGTVSP